MTLPASLPVPYKILIVYAFPAFVIAIPTIPVYLHLPTLYGVEMGIGLAATGGLLLVARLFDTVTDPLIGYLSDRFPILNYRRKPWILLGASIGGWGLIMLLAPPANADGYYLLRWSLVLYAGWTMVTVPYLTWGAELHTDYNERARITGWREGLALAGILVAGGLAAYMSEKYGPDSAPGTLAWSTVVLGAVFIPLLVWVVPEPQPVRTTSMLKLNIVHIKSLARNKPFLRLLSAWFINGLANGIPAALFFLYLEHALEVSANERSRFILVYFLAAILAIPLWLRLSSRLSKHRTWCWAMCGAITAFITVPFLPPGAELYFFTVCLVTGAALGADLVLPPAIQADVADYDRWRFKVDRTGLQFALWGMATKLALATAVGLALPGVEWLGFNPEEVTSSGRTALIMIYAGLPVVIKIVAIAIVWHFPLNVTRQKIVRRRLDGQAKSY